MGVRRRGRRVTLWVATSALVAAAAAAGVYWSELEELWRAYQLGYRFVWLPEGVVIEPGPSLSDFGDVAGRRTYLSALHGKSWHRLIRTLCDPSVPEVSRTNRYLSANLALYASA